MGRPKMLEDTGAAGVAITDDLLAVVVGFVFVGEEL